MKITAEISYYALMNQYQEPVGDFINEIRKNPKITLEPGTMSSMLTGDYEEIMDLLKQQIKPFMEKYPSVFSLKISNACKSLEDL